eukprot:8726724-Pyramimonas_sp.AAC.1
MALQALPDMTTDIVRRAMRGQPGATIVESNVAANPTRCAARDRRPTNHAAERATMADRGRNWSTLEVDCEVHMARQPVRMHQCPYRGR